MEKLVEEGTVGLSAVTYAVVLAGSEVKDRPATEEMLGSFNVLPVDREVASIAGRCVADDGAAGSELGDYLVAATALKLGAVLVTLGLRRYPGNTELRLVSY